MRVKPSWRQPVGIFLILAWIVAWSALVVTASAIVTGLHWAMQLIYYAVAGFVWILPLKPLLRWMETSKWRSEQP